MLPASGHNGLNRNNSLVIHSYVPSPSTHPVFGRRRRLRVRPTQVLLLCSALALLAIYVAVAHWRPVVAVLLPLNVLAFYFNAPIVLSWDEGGSYKW